MSLKRTSIFLLVVIQVAWTKSLMKHAVLKRFHSLSHSSNRLSLTLRATAVDDKLEVEEYFNNEGFNRWNKIYSDSDEVNKVQLDIRTGHQQTIDKVLNWLADEQNSGKTICDAGCGVASKFKKVFASDISAAMTKEAAARAQQNKIKNIEFKVASKKICLNAEWITV
jgi:SAM-dependent methyltransferase